VKSKSLSTDNNNKNKHKNNNNVAFCFSLQPMTAYRPVRDGTPSLAASWNKMLVRAATVVQVLHDLFYVLLHVSFYLWSLLYLQAASYNMQQATSKRSYHSCDKCYKLQGNGRCLPIRGTFSHYQRQQQQKAIKYGPAKLRDSIRIRIGNSIRFDSIPKWLTDSKIFESNRPCMPLARRKLSQTTQTINGA